MVDGEINLVAAWAGMILGMIAGAIQGLFFHKKEWMGGYTTWRRRMIRLGHISLFGIGFINAIFALSVRYYGLENSITVPSVLFIVGAITMPLVCYLSAFRKFFRHIFFIPVLSILLGALIFFWGGIIK